VSAPARTARRRATAAGAAGADPAATGAGAAVPPSGVPRWAAPAGLALSVAGLAVAAYLTVAHYTTSAILACSDSGIVNCGKVTTSPESVILGIPVAVLGLVFFASMIGLNLPVAWRRGGLALGLVRQAAVVVGIGFVLYLVSAELLVIGAICLWCTSVHVLTFLLFLVVTAATVDAWPAWSGS
jgi:uncharacterized membrane protein